MLDVSSFFYVGDYGWAIIYCKLNKFSFHFYLIKAGKNIYFFSVGTDYSLNVFEGIIFCLIYFFFSSLNSTYFYFYNLK